MLVRHATRECGSNYDRAYAVAIEHLQTVSIGALEFADGDELSAGDADLKWRSIVGGK